MRATAVAACAGAAAAAVITLPGLGNGTLWDNSETAYGEVAREILIFHDWIVLHLNGLPWYVQPPLYFWIAAICIKILGVSSFALRLPAALATIGSGAVTAAAVARIGGARAGVYAGIVLSTCLMQAVVGRLAIMDALLDLAVAVAVFACFFALRDADGVKLIVAGGAAGLGFLAKGLVSPVIVVLVLGAFAAWEWRIGAAVRLPRLRYWLAAVAVFLAIALPWPIALYGRQGVYAVEWLIGHYTIGRYTGTIQNQAGPLWYYLPVLVIGFFPWIAFLPSAIASSAKLLRNEGADAEASQLVRLSYVWIVVPLLFFSFAGTKLPNYIALEFPALAATVALYLRRAVERRSRSALISTASVPIATLLVGVAIAVFVRDNRLAAGFHQLADNLVYVGVALFAGSLLTFVLFSLRRTPASAPFALGGAMALALVLLAVLALPKAEQFKPVPHLAAIINSSRRPGDAVSIESIAGGNALVFYTRPHVYVIARKNEDPDQPGVSAHSVVCHATRIWMIAPRSRAQDDPTFGRRREFIAQWGKAALVLYSGRRCSG